MKAYDWLHIDAHLAEKSIPPNFRIPLCRVDLYHTMLVSFTDITFIIHYLDQYTQRIKRFL